MHKHQSTKSTGLGTALLNKIQTGKTSGTRTAKQARAEAVKPARNPATTAPKPAALNFGPRVRVIGPGSETPESAGLKGQALAEAQIKRAFRNAAK